MEVLSECAAVALVKSGRHFVYRLIPNGKLNVEEQYQAFAAISSDDSLTFFRIVPKTNAILVDQTMQEVNRGIACLESLDESKNILVTAGRDGAIHLFDGSARQRTRTLRTPRKEAVSAIAPSKDASYLVVGTDLQGNGPGEVTIYMWQVQSTEQAPVHAFRDWHTDSITTLAFHPGKTHVMFSGSTDGLITCFDLRNMEDEAEPLDIISTVSSIRQVQPLCDQSRGADDSMILTVAVLTHDEKICFYSTTQTEHDGDGTSTSKTWEFRSALNVDYAIALSSSNGIEDRVVLVAGTNKSYATYVFNGKSA